MEASGQNRNVRLFDDQQTFFLRLVGAAFGIIVVGGIALYSSHVNLPIHHGAMTAEQVAERLRDYNEHHRREMQALEEDNDDLRETVTEMHRWLVRHGYMPIGEYESLHDLPPSERLRPRIRGKRP